MEIYTKRMLMNTNTCELGYDGLNGTRKIAPSYAKSVVYIWRILDMHRNGTKHIIRHMQKSVIQWFVISKFTCISHLELCHIFLHTNERYNCLQISNFKYQPHLTLMLLLANLANKKWCKKSWKTLETWHVGTHLRELRESFPMITNITGFRWFLKNFVYSSHGRK